MTLNILALDTSGDACSIALLLKDHRILTKEKIMPAQQSTWILPFIETLLNEAALSLSELDALAFGCGPGSFTGLRIAAGVTQGLAFGANLPVVPISTLRALAEGAHRQTASDVVLSVIDARMQEVYWGVYQWDSEQNSMVAVIEDSVSGVSHVVLPTELNTSSCAGVGSGWQVYLDALQHKTGIPFIRINAEAYPKAEDIARLAVNDYHAGRTVSAEQALPVYLRDTVAWKHTE